MTSQATSKYEQKHIHTGGMWDRLAQALIYLGLHAAPLPRTATVSFHVPLSSSGALLAGVPLQTSPDLSSF